MDLFEQSSLCIVAQIELLAKLVNNIFWIVIFKNLDLFQMMAVKFDLEHADWLLNGWQSIL